MRYLTLIFVCFLMIGCSRSYHRSNPGNISAANLESSAVEVNRSVKGIEQASDIIESKTQDIIKGSDKIINTTDDPQIQREANDIKQNSNDVLNEIRRIDEERADIAAQQDIINKSVSRMESLENQVENYEDEGSVEAKEKLYNLIIGMSAFGGVSVLGGIILFFFNPRMGAMVAAFGLVTSVIAVAGVYYLKWIAVAGFALLGMSLVITLIFMIRAFLQAKTYKETTESTVKIVDLIKNEIPDETREKLFADGGIIDSNQSPKVKHMVKEIKLSLQEESKKQKGLKEK